jgi:hypothetical protein
MNDNGSRYINIVLIACSFEVLCFFDTSRASCEYPAMVMLMRVHGNVLVSKLVSVDDPISLHC